MNTDTETSNTSTDTATLAACPQSGFTRNGWLWMSASVLMVLIMVQGAGLLDSRAHADMTTTVQSYSMMTTDGGTDEVLVVVDSRQESLLIYRVDSSNRLKLHKREQLDILFTRARAQLLPSP